MLDLAAIEQRVNVATPGPWEQAWHAQRKPICLITNGTKFGIYGNAPCDYQHDDDANGEFIAAARSDIPALIARVRELEAEHKALQAVAEAAEDAEEALGTVERWVKLQAALAEWRALCPR